jgi:hypothetical protein
MNGPPVRSWLKQMFHGLIQVLGDSEWVERVDTLRVSVHLFILEW